MSGIPDWAQRERQADLGWIAEHLDAFSAIASLAFKDEGRGAIVVDVTSQPVAGAGQPFAYSSQEAIEGQGDADRAGQPPPPVADSPVRRRPPYRPR